jgi:ABC-type nitrate/sulfonate/bicarbonate transport system substrate-binding protein
MLKFSRSILLLNLTLIFAAPALLLAQERYIASYAGFAGFQAPLWAAQDFGLLAKYNVNMDLVMIPGSARGAQALLGGSTHFGQIDGTALISAINQGADLVFIGASLNKFLFSLVTQKNIRRPADLIGKKVGMVSFGGAHEVSLVLALKEWNITAPVGDALGQRPGRESLNRAFERRPRRHATRPAGDRRSGTHGPTHIG